MRDVTRDSATSASAESGQEEIDLVRAATESTDPAFLARLCRAPTTPYGSTVRNLALKNPALPVAEMARIVQAAWATPGDQWMDFGDVVALLENASFPGDLLEQVLTRADHAGGLAGAVQNAAIEHPNCPESWMRWAALHSRARLNLAVAANVNLTVEAALILLDDPTWTVRWELTGNPGYPAAALPALVAVSSATQLHALAGKVTGENRDVVVRAVQDSSPENTWSTETRHCVALFTRDPALITRLCQDSTQLVRHAAANNACATDADKVLAALLS